MNYKGAIVSIQDVHQHMYISVEGSDEYNLAGVLHYSLVGDRALFRVILCIYLLHQCWQAFSFLRY